MHCSNFRGMYVCRTLSYKGAEFEVIEAPLEAEMMVCDVDLIFYFRHQKMIVNIFTPNCITFTGRCYCLVYTQLYVCHC